jgi:DNA-directed RNA polymerase subunit RPC12/RpoP
MVNDMKTIVCGRCHKKVEVEDSYGFTRCETCRVKDEGDNILRKEQRRLERESEEYLESLGLEKPKLNPIFWSYSAYAENHERLFHHTPTFEEYKEAVNEEYRKQARVKADLLTKKWQREKKENKLIFCDENKYPCYTDLCIEARQGIIRATKDFTIYQHLNVCKTCAKWQVWYKHTREEEYPTGELPDASAFSGGAELWGSGQPVKEETHEEEVKRKALTQDYGFSSLRSEEDTEGREVKGFEGDLDRKMFDDHQSFMMTPKERQRRQREQQERELEQQINEQYPEESEED